MDRLMMNIFKKLYTHEEFMRGVPACFISFICFSRHVTNVVFLFDYQTEHSVNQG